VRRIVSCVVSGRDIIEQYKSEHALRASEAKYAAIFEKSPYALAIASSPGGKFTSVNDAFLRLFEYTREEVLGKTSADLGMADDESRQKALEGLRENGSVFGMECIRYTKTRRAIHVAMSLSWVQTGEIAHVLVTIEDLSARKEAAEAKRWYPDRKAEFASHCAKFSIGFRSKSPMVVMGFSKKIAIAFLIASGTETNEKAAAPASDWPS
jgi:PAS domain S-box-containing protein